MTTSEHQSNRSSPARPGVLSVEVTGRCTRRCTYCYNHWADGPSPPPDLPGPTLVALVRSVLAQSGLSAVQVSGGEPLLRPDLPEVLEGIRPLVRSLSLVTDGADLDDRTIETLASLHIGPVQPTLLAARRDVHDGMKGAPCFDRTVEGIARLVRGRVPVSVAFVCTGRNAAYFEEVVELCFALGVKHVALSRFCTAGRGARYSGEMEPEPGQVAACLEVAENAWTSLGVRVHVAISLPLCAFDRGRYPNLRFGRCAVSGGSPGFTLDPAGRLRACSVSAVVLGDLTVETWDSVLARAREKPLMARVGTRALQGSVLAHAPVGRGPPTAPTSSARSRSPEGYLRDASRLPSACSGCDLADSCGGGCRESAFGRFGDWDHPDPLALVERK